MTHQELFVSEKPRMVRVSQGTWQPTGSRETTGAPVPARALRLQATSYLWASPVKWVWTGSSQDLRGGQAASSPGGQCLAPRDKFLSSLLNRHVGGMCSSDDTCTRLWHPPLSPGPVPMWKQGLVHGNTLQRAVALGPGPLPRIPGKPLEKTLVFLGKKRTGQSVQTFSKLGNPLDTTSAVGI